MYGTGEELFLGTCDSRGVGGVGVLINTSMAKIIGSFEQLTTRIVHLGVRSYGPTPALTTFVAYAPTSGSLRRRRSKCFYMDLKKSYREDHQRSWTWESPGRVYRNEIEHITATKRFCLEDFAVAPKYYTEAENRFL
ncbi:hypothetical protein RB195_021530 [Necator americanus]|uniref:Uncharacterized protein n=1 Tax=Necator americanus TaxID=51031 RepID=A0ABR1EBT2_NECAM